MENEVFDDDVFVVSLTIDGTPYENIEVKISNPWLPIKEQIKRIIDVFELPQFDNGGSRIQYLLGQIMEDGQEPEILEFEDEDGREQALIDYNIQPGDHLQLINLPIPGGIWCNIIVVMTINFLLFRYQYLKIVKVTDINGLNGDIYRLYGSPEYHIEKIVAYLKLNKRREYFLAKLENKNNEIKFYFLNGPSSDGKRQGFIAEDYDILKPQGNDYPYLLLLPSSGITNRTIKILKKIIKVKPKYKEI